MNLTKMDELFCPKCMITRRGKFCRTCGTVLIPAPPKPKCSCGQEIEDYDEYCRWCGEKIKEEAKGQLGGIP